MRRPILSAKPACPVSLAPTRLISVTPATEKLVLAALLLLGLCHGQYHHSVARRGRINHCLAPSVTRNATARKFIDWQVEYAIKHITTFPVSEHQIRNNR